MGNILITGGAGYIGSHTVIELLDSGHQVVIVDNYSNSKPEVLHRLERITGIKPLFYEVDLLDKVGLEAVFEAHDFDAVIHFAGLKAVGESVKVPLWYYHNNIMGTLVLLETMAKYGVKTLVFSSSATVYGMNNVSPLVETMPLSATNPYGQTKLMIEQILQDLGVSDSSWRVALLRYFNPIGAHESGLIGEDPNGIPNNLMPYVTQVAVGKLKELSVYGSDYETHDGTGVRDYIHVVDLAKGHVKALDYVLTNSGVESFNLGTGNGYSVLDVVKNFEVASGAIVPYKLAPRRPGDVAECYADAIKAKSVLGWEASYDILRMCQDSWRWQSGNPMGYE